MILLDPEKAKAELLRLIDGGETHPNPKDLSEGIISIIDDELIDSMEQVMEDAMFNTSARSVMPAMENYSPAWELLKKLRTLQKARIRRAVFSFVRPGIS